MSEREELERRLDLAAELALRARERLETAINAGHVPSWVLDACSVIEKASVQYGELAEQLRKLPAETVTDLDHVEPDPALASLTIH